MHRNLISKQPTLHRMYYRLKQTKKKANVPNKKQNRIGGEEGIQENRLQYEEKKKEKEK